MTVNWEFVDNATVESAKQLVDDLRSGREVRSTRGPVAVRTFREVERVLAGFPDGLAGEGVAAGPATLAGLALTSSSRPSTSPPSPRSRTAARPNPLPP